VVLEVESLVFKMANPTTAVSKAKREHNFYIHVPMDVALQLGLENNNTVVALVYKIVDVKSASRETIRKERLKE